MRVSPSLRRKAAAALCAVLLPLGVLQEGVHAQATDAGASVRTVTNIAEASWDVQGTRQQIASNSVIFDVILPPVAPASVAWA